MEYSLRTIAVLDLDSQLAADLRQLTFSPNGMMAQALTNVIAAPRRGEQSVAVLASSPAGQLVGWALVFPHRHSARFEAYFFVDPAYRRSGIGTALAAEIRRLKPRHKLMVRPGSQGAYSFFSGLPRFEAQGTPGHLRMLADGELG